VIAIFALAATAKAAAAMALQDHPEFRHFVSGPTSL
jgi:hypothetical protein